MKAVPARDIIESKQSKNTGRALFGGIMMSEKENPIIHISGTLTLKDYMAAVRAGGLRSMLIISVIILPGSFLCTLLINLPDWIPYLKDGRATLGEWLNTY